MAKRVKLTHKEEQFCQEWFITKFNGTESAFKAGFTKNRKSAGVKASKLLAKDNIQKRIAELYKELSEKNENQKNEVIDELRLISFSDIKDYLTVEEGGAITAKTFEEMPENASRSIRKVRTKRTIRESKDGSDSMIIDDTFEFELYSKEKCLEMLGKVEALFTDNVNHKGRIGLDLSGKTDEELENLVKGK